MINKNTRTTCKACRLTKCIQVGMSKGGSKFGRRSNWFKINFLLEEKQKATMKMNSLSEQMKSVADSAGLFTAAATPLFAKFPPPPSLSSQNQPSPSSTSSSNSLDLTAPLSQYTKLAGAAVAAGQPDHIALQTHPFYSMQYPFHTAFLQTAIEAAYYLKQNVVQQQQQQHQQQPRNESMSSNDDMDSDDASNGGSGGGDGGGVFGEQQQRSTETAAAAAAANLRIASSPTPSASSSSSTNVSLSSSSIAVPSSDNQDYPIDLSIKSSPRQVDFSISNLLKIPTA